jgi:hypothetical protein
MKGGTTFHFIDASPAQALAAAREAAGGLDVRIGGGPATIRQFLAAGLIDHMHIALVPVLLGRGESLWDGLEGLEERFAIESVSSPSGVTHVTFTRRQPRLGLPRTRSRRISRLPDVLGVHAGMPYPSRQRFARRNQFRLAKR